MRFLDIRVATGRARHDPTTSLRGAIPPSIVKRHTSITDPAAIGGLLRAIDGDEGSLITKSALKLTPLLFVRPGELRMAEWSEFDFDNNEWRIPAVRMKMRDHYQELLPVPVQRARLRFA